MSDLPAMPAFIQFHGDDELYFVRSHSALREDTPLRLAQFHPEDRLVDANGNLYTVQRGHDSHLDFARTAECLSLETVLQLVRRHAAQDGACCVAKLSAGSIAEAIAMLD